MTAHMSGRTFGFRNTTRRALLDFAYCTQTYGAVGLRPFLSYLGASLRESAGATSVRLPDIAVPLLVRHRTSDAESFSQIFFRRTYDTARFSPYHRKLFDLYNETVGTKRTPLILDAGANVGFSSAWFANLYKQAQIYAIEPDEENFAVLAENAQQFTNIVPLRSAIWDKCSTVRIVDDSAPYWARQVA